ncbi:hypothetical protein Acr_00g0075900 [Actinidia rufa]|uniref:Uncharacterized protein n=1 Tax=Actinidia rufa TaxID=165716 RepID=A0A7J0DSU1_9ERIC|nr:hypothetical protein Acr_00g0075900 [Actinidia rufa]
MASRTRRLSLDIFKREASDKPSDMGISKYMDLRVPFQPGGANDVKKVECECCGLTEDCTGAYIWRTRARFYGKWVCGLCSEAVTEESYKLGRVHNIICEEALDVHMEICRRFNKTTKANPAMSLAGAMIQILKISCTKTR